MNDLSILNKGIKLKVLSIIRFRPKAGRMEEVIDELKAHNEKCRKKIWPATFFISNR